jgi:hypothetical protein
MFILHVKHYFCQEILKVHSLQKRCRVSIFITLTSGKLQDFWSSGFGFRQGLRQPRPQGLPRGGARAEEDPGKINTAEKRLRMRQPYL